MRRALVLWLLACLAWAGPAAAQEVDFEAVVASLVEQGDAVLAEYAPQHGADAADLLSGLYFDVFEGSGMEAAVGLDDPARKGALESRFGAVIGEAARGAPAPQVAAAWDALKADLRATAAARPASAGGFWGLLVQSFLILVREGFEAMLVVTALLAYLRKVGAAAQQRVVYHGVGWAVLASALTAWLLGAVFAVSGAGREALEGITMLLAAAVLFYVSYWLFARREAARWQAYIRGHIDRALSRGSLFTLGFAAFLAVYREGAETVLFYQALAGQADGRYAPLLAGFAAGAVALAVVYLLLRDASRRLPLGLFFGVTAALLYYLAVSFAGHGVLELQEAGWVGITPLAGIPRVQWLGLFPTAEGVAAQALLVVPALLLLGVWALRRRASAVAGG